MSFIQPITGQRYGCVLNACLYSSSSIVPSTLSSTDDEPLLDDDVALGLDLALAQVEVRSSDRPPARAASAISGGGTSSTYAVKS